MNFPIYRPRRLRANETIRRMVRETNLSPADFILPLFVTYGKGVKNEIKSMPGPLPDVDRQPQEGSPRDKSPSAYRPSSSSAYPSTRTRREPAPFDPHGPCRRR